MFWKKKNSTIKTITAKVEIPEALTRQDPEEEERMHEEELRKILEGMDRRELKIVCEYIPNDILIEQIRYELEQKESWRKKIDEMYNQIGGDQNGSC